MLKRVLDRVLPRLIILFCSFPIAKPEVFKEMEQAAVRLAEMVSYR